jgi:mannose-6-phosphate isomerase
MISWVVGGGHASPHFQRLTVAPRGHFIGRDPDASVRPDSFTQLTLSSSSLEIERERSVEESGNRADQLVGREQSGLPLLRRWIFAARRLTRETVGVNFLDYEERPWGSFTVLVDDADHKVKSILVAPGQRLSYQTHARRSEHWFVVRGEGAVVLDGVAHEVGPGSTIDVPQGMAHRIKNAGSEDLVFIEVQHGDYFGEDDIVRLDDDFGRA